MTLVVKAGVSLQKVYLHMLAAKQVTVHSKFEIPRADGTTDTVWSDPEFGTSTSDAARRIAPGPFDVELLGAETKRGGGIQTMYWFGRVSQSAIWHHQRMLLPTRRG